MSNNLPAMAKQEVARVEKRIAEMQENGQIHLPEDYSASNALRSAYLNLQETKDKQGNPALEVCTTHSIANALLDMVIMGLNPSRKQCYFIVFGKSLTCMRSYHGTRALAFRADNSITDIVAEVVWEGDTLEYDILLGRKQIVKHKQTLDNVDSRKPRAAYCIIFKDGEPWHTEIMTWEQILSAWKKSPIKPVLENGKLKEGSTHAEFTSEMVKRTVTNRACKLIINSSSDKYLYQAAVRSDLVQAEEEAQDMADEYANREIIDLAPEPMEEPEDDKKQPGIDPGF